MGIFDQLAYPEDLFMEFAEHLELRYPDSSFPEHVPMSQPYRAIPSLQRLPLKASPNPPLDAPLNLKRVPIFFFLGYSRPSSRRFVEDSSKFFNTDSFTVMEKDMLTKTQAP